MVRTDVPKLKQLESIDAFLWDGRIWLAVLIYADLDGVVFLDQFGRFQPAAPWVAASDLCWHNDPPPDDFLSAIVVRWFDRESSPEYQVSYSAGSVVLGVISVLASWPIGVKLQWAVPPLRPN